LVVEKAKSRPAAAAQPDAAPQQDLAFYAAANSDDQAARVIVNLSLAHR
jgi:hypothetical protein